jgi:Phosphotransferase enzyme family
LESSALDDDLCHVLWSGFGIQVDAATPILGGDECLLWHVTAPRSLVVRAAPVWRSDAELRWAYGVAAALRAYVPEAVTPESPGIARWRGRALTIWPYVPGRHLDRDRPDDRDAAARLLARLHRAALLVADPGPRPPSDPGGPADWPRITEASRPRSATAGRLRVATAGSPRVATAGDMSDPELDDTLASWRAGAGAVAPRGPVHGDFYRRNVLDCDGRLALLDWDEVRIDAVSVELGWAVWEFGHSGSALDPARAYGFLDEYRRAGGPPYDARMMVPFIRDRLRWEVARSRSAAVVGEYHDLAYEADEVRAFTKLHGVTLGDQER